MSLGFEKFTFTEINLNLDLAMKWFCEKGINIKNSRFEAIRNNMLTITTYHEQGKISDLRSKWGNEKIIASLKESVPFMNIYKAFSDLKEHQCVPKKSLIKIINGPFLSKDEDKVTNEARNFLFELELAAIFKLKGLKIESFDDVSFKLEGTVYNIQCKRPMSVKSIGENIVKAVYQAQTYFERVEEGIELRGIIALSIDKIFDTDKIIITQNSAYLENYAKKELKDFVDEFRHEWNKIIDIRILAVFIFLKRVVEVKETGVLSTLSYTLIDILTPNSPVTIMDNHRIQVLQRILSP